MKEGPCGDVFVAAYRCFLESKAEERGSDCLDQFQAMQACFVENADCASPPPGSLASNTSPSCRTARARARHCNACLPRRGPQWSSCLNGLPARLTRAGCWLADYEEKEEEREAAKKKALADGDKEGDSNSWASGSADGEPSGTWK